MKKCNITFQDEDSIQQTIIHCELNDNGDLDFKLSFEPPVTEDSDLGLSGQLANVFCQFLSGK